MALLHTALAGLATGMSGVDRVVIAGEGTLARKSKGLPDLPPLSDLWHDSEQFEDGARNQVAGLAMVAWVFLVEGGIE